MGVVWAETCVAAVGIGGGASAVAVPCGLGGGVSFWVCLLSFCRGAWWVACLVVLGFAVSRHVVSCRVMSCCVASRRVVSCRGVSRHVMSLTRVVDMSR